MCYSFAAAEPHEIVGTGSGAFMTRATIAGLQARFWSTRCAEEPDTSEHGAALVTPCPSAAGARL